MKKYICAALTILIAINLITVSFAADYTDVNKDHWAYSQINKATENGFISGMGNNVFGLGKNVTKAQFISMASRMFGWEEKEGQFSSLNDNQDPSKWYHNSIEAAVLNGAINDGGYFNPDNFITREEIAVILVKALGYDCIAETAERENIPFNDVTTNKGYIALAYNFGIISGKSATKFEPKGLATREEAAAMLIRCFDKINLDTEFINGFYAFNSYSQKDLAADMNTVSFGWSRMEYTNEKGVVLNTLSQNGNEWVVPKGYEDIIQYIKQNNVKAHLNIYMSNGESQMCDKILNNAQNRTAAINAIIDELTVNYNKLGYNPYDGVTIDFENIKGTESKENFNLFIIELRTQLNKIQKSLYVAVQPKLKTGAYFDGYDFKTISQNADKIILMAYDYYPKTISKEVMDSGFTTTPVTPFDEVYYGVKAIVDDVDDKSKIVMGLSVSNAGWKVENGTIVNSNAISFNQSTIINDIKSGANVKYLEKYKSPYLNIIDSTGNTVIWFENSKSISEKIKLAQMFGISGISIWRLGIIPNDASVGMDIWEIISK